MTSEAIEATRRSPEVRSGVVLVPRLVFQILPYACKAIFDKTCKSTPPGSTIFVVPQPIRSRFDT